MLIDHIDVSAEPGITDEEIKEVVDEERRIWKSKGKELAAVQLRIQGDEIEVKTVERSPIKRVRRITGYLSTEDRFNPAKQAELTDRWAHM